MIKDSPFVLDGSGAMADYRGRRSRANQIPRYVVYAMYALTQKSYEAYLVGGAVRDMLMGRDPNDYDIATNATPEQVQEVFASFEIDNEVIPTGIKHGTVTVLLHEHGDSMLDKSVSHKVEITTYRVDGAYEDSRRPETVEFVSDIRQDLARRDFTINAIAMDMNGNLVDPYGGYDDIQRKVIRAVGEAEERFAEDALRMMRAIRFYAQFNQYGFVVDQKTLDAIAVMSYKLKDVSQERIRDEFNKMILSEKPSRSIRLLSAYGLLHLFLPELSQCVGFEQRNPHHCYDIFGHIMAVLDGTAEVSQSLTTRLGALYHDIGKPATFSVGDDGVGHFYGHDGVGADIAEQILRRMKYDGTTINTVKMIVNEHMNRFVNPSKKVIKRQLGRIGNLDLYKELAKVQLADIAGHAATDRFGDYYSGVRQAVGIAAMIVAEGEATTVKALDVNGHDLKEIGIPAGKIMGVILNTLLEEVIEERIPNSRDELLLYAKSLYASWSEEEQEGMQ